MTDTLARKPRWSAADKRARAGNAGGIERRGQLAGTKEARFFAASIATTPSVRSFASGGNLIEISGTPIVYNKWYSVNDQFGSFLEIVKPGVVSALLATTDTRLLFDHSGLPVARTSAGTLTLTDTPKALSFAAGLDPRQSLANDLAIAIQRGDISQMSSAFTVPLGGDVWNADFGQRTIFKFDQLFDVSAVTFPASPTTEIFLDELPDVGGPDGTQGGGAGSPDAGIADGTGSRSADIIARMIQIDEDRFRLSRPPELGKTTRRRSVAPDVARMIQIDQDRLRFSRPPVLV